jgi:DNA-binding Lrp family transcriptional regulator
MDDTDRRIIAVLEPGLPDSATPYEDAAEALGLDPDELLRRLEGMRRSGVLRAVRAVLDQRKLALEGNVLVAWAVPEERVDEVGRLFSLRRDVSHCVLRDAADDWPYNLYTMIHARTSDEAIAVVRALAQSSGVTEHVALETLRELKKVPPRYS